MSTLKRFAKNTLILILAKVIQPLLTFVLVIVISRRLGVEEFGAYSTIFKYVPIFQIVAGFGLRNLIAREVAQDKAAAPRYLIAASYVALLCAVASALLMSGVVNLLSDEPLVILGTILASVALIAAGLADVYEGFFAGYEKLKHVGYASIAENTFRVGLSVALIYSGFGVIAVVLVFVVARFLKSLYYYWYINSRMTRAVGKVDRRFIMNLVHQAKTFALIMICVTIYWNADGVMLESMRSAEEVGYYSAAYRFLAISMVLVHSYVTSLFPVIANYFKTSRAKFRMACTMSLRILILITLPIAIVFAFLAEKIILLLFQEPFLPSVKVLQILIWTLVPYAISQIFAYALVASNNQKVDLAVNAFSMLANVTLNLILIPRFGYIGATIATLVSIHIYVGLQIPFVLKKLLTLDYKAVISQALRFGIAAAAMIACIVLLRQINLFAILPLAFVTYAAGVLGLGLISQSDRQLVLKMLRPAA